MKTREQHFTLHSSFILYYNYNLKRLRRLPVISIVLSKHFPPKVWTASNYALWSVGGQGERQQRQLTLQKDGFSLGLDQSLQQIKAVSHQNLATAFSQGNLDKIKALVVLLLDTKNKKKNSKGLTDTHTLNTNIITTTTHKTTIN